MKENIQYIIDQIKIYEMQIYTQNIFFKYDKTQLNKRISLKIQRPLVLIRVAGVLNYTSLFPSIFYS